MSTHTVDDAENRVGALSTWTLVLSLVAGVLYAVPKISPNLTSPAVAFWAALVPAAFGLDTTVTLLVLRGKARRGGRRAVAAIVLGLLATAVIVVPDLISLAQTVFSFIHGTTKV